MVRRRPGKGALCAEPSDDSSKTVVLADFIQCDVEWELCMSARGATSSADCTRSSPLWPPAYAPVCARASGGWAARGRYAGVLQQVRCQAAEHLLPIRRARSTTWPARSATPHFPRAFPRWTGLTPTDFRRRAEARVAGMAKRRRSGASSRRRRRRDEETRGRRPRRHRENRVPHGHWGGEDQSAHANA